MSSSSMDLRAEAFEEAYLDEKSKNPMVHLTAKEIYKFGASEECGRIKHIIMERLKHYPKDVFISEQFGILRHVLKQLIDEIDK